MKSAWDASAKYKYSEYSTIHNPQEIGADGNIHTWTLELNGQNFRVTREVWEAYHKELAALREAGEKMAKQLRDLRGFQEEAEARGQSSITVEVDHIFNSEDDAALTAWEAANK